MTKEQIDEEVNKALVALGVMAGHRMITMADRARLSKKVKAWWYDRMQEVKEPTL